MDNQNISTLDRLLQITEQLVSEKGCHRTTLQAIIEKSGLSKGAIYHYVTSKDELLGLVLKRNLGETNRQFDEAVNVAVEHNSTFHPFERMAQRMTREDEQGRVSNEIYLYLVSQRDKLTVRKILEDLYQYQHDLYVRWFQVGQQASAIPASLDIEQAVATLQIVYAGLRIHRAIKESSQQVQVPFVVQMLLRLLAPSFVSTENKDVYRGNHDGAVPLEK